MEGAVLGMEEESGSPVVGEVGPGLASGARGIACVVVGLGEIKS